MQLPAGWIIDRIGVRLSLALAVGWWSLFTIATGFARGVSQFIGARLMLGVGEAASLPSFAKVAFNWFPRRERGVACSIFNSGSTAGSALSIPLVTWLIVIVGWRGAFIVTGLLGIVWVLLWWFVYRDPERHRAIAPAEVDALLAERAAHRRGHHQNLLGRPVPLPLHLGPDDRHVLPELRDLFLHHLVSQLHAAGARLLADFVRGAGHGAGAVGDCRQLAGRLDIRPVAEDRAGAPRARARPVWSAACWWPRR